MTDKTKLKKAVNLVENYNEWRRGSDKIGMPDPKDLGIAIDVLLDHAKRTMQPEDATKAQLIDALELLLDDAKRVEHAVCSYADGHEVYTGTEHIVIKAQNALEKARGDK